MPLPSRLCSFRVGALRVRTAAARHADARIERPRIPRLHLDIDHAVPVVDGTDADVLEVAIAAQQALGLVDDAHRNRLAGLKEQLTADGLGACLHVQAVGQPEERFVLVGIVKVEDVLRVHQDAADDRTHGFEFAERGERRQFRQRLRDRRLQRCEKHHGNKEARSNSEICQLWSRSSFPDTRS
jgi:hypothetical protein